ncbi:MAG: hypothetical protein ACFB8W_10830 [Elainellaceae cyanobacterium]
MKILNQLGKAVQSSGKLLQTYVKDYIAINPPSKQVTLKPKAVLLLCQQAIAKVEQLTGLEPDASEGLIATVEYQQVKARIHFTPEKLTLRGDRVEGQLRLMNAPQFETSSLVYRALIAGWKTFLGGYIPNQVLPEGVRVEGERVYYQLPKAQLQVVEALFHNLEDGSALNLNLKQGELQIESAVAINWSDLNLQALLKILHASASGEQKD